MVNIGLAGRIFKSIIQTNAEKTISIRDAVRALLSKFNSNSWSVYFSNNSLVSIIFSEFLLILILLIYNFIYLILMGFI